MQTYPEPVLVDFVRGDATGLDLPAHAEALGAAGPEFLTAAFRAYGAIAADNRVTAITGFARCHAGNSGDKLLLSVAYAHPEPGLHEDLFVKFSRDFSDAFRDRRRRELEPEVRLAALSRLPAFPVTVAKAYFADFADDSGTGLLITQRIAFGADGIEPEVAKNMDHELADPAEYYRATLGALARLAGAHKAGRLSPEVDTLFPYDAAVAAAEIPNPAGLGQMRAKVEKVARFIARCPQLFPANVRAPAFLARFSEEATLFVRHEAEIRRFLHADADLIALTHWNTHLDNAWFWRGADGVLRCGLLDWGMVRQMNVAYGLWGGISAASLDFWDDNLDPLLDFFTGELYAAGGPRLDRERLELHFTLAASLICLAMFMDTPALVLSRMPAAVNARGPLDPMLHADPVVHGFLHGFTNFLYLWESRDFGAAIAKVIAPA